MEVNKLIELGDIGEVYYVKRCNTQFDRRRDWQTLSQCGSDYKRMISFIRHVAAAGDCEDVVMASFEGINGKTVRLSN